MAALGIVLLPLLSDPVAAQMCRQSVANHLAALRVSKAEVAKVDYVLRLDNVRTGAAAGAEAWVKLRSCRGGLVLVTDRTCRVRRTYGHGGCRGFLGNR